MQEINLVSGQVRVALTGKLYVEDAADLREKLLKYLDQGYPNFVINLAGVDYIDSSGLGVLVAIQKRALENKGGVIIHGLRGAVKEIFELTRLTKVFEIHV